MYGTFEDEPSEEKREVNCSVIVSKSMVNGKVFGGDKREEE